MQNEQGPGNKRDKRATKVVIIRGGSKVERKRKVRKVRKVRKRARRQSYCSETEQRKGLAVSLSSKPSPMAKGRRTLLLLR